MQILINGLVAGSTAALLAYAFSMVYLPTRIFHIALAGVYPLVASVAWSCLQCGFPWYVAVGLGIPTGIGVSVLCELLNHASLEKKGASPQVHFVSSLGINMFLVQIVALMWGSETKVLRRGVDRVIDFGPVFLTRMQMLTLFASLTVLICVWTWLRFTRVGLFFRALADNPREFTLTGASVSAFRLLAFGISGFLVAVAALLSAFDVGFDPYVGLPAVLLAMVSMIVGGRESFLGPLIGGFLLGISRAYVVWFLSAKWQDPVTFALFAMFLLFRPNGLVARKVRLEAAP